MTDPHVLGRLIVGMSDVFDVMDAATIDAWDGLTGLQIQLLRVVATDMRVDRGSLAVWTRTSRAALVPSLAALLHRGVLAEETDGIGPHLVVAPAGRQLLAAVLVARAGWLREAASAVGPVADEEELRRTAELMEKLAATTTQGATGPDAS
ncbi:MarR family transcriptional regulator [Clavibacter michiganensis]|uniref:MarR family transcriptional regulator n=1 Tax=Clavibacter michiganensis TaxID=28447 RepID=A0A251XVZ5_9MICO|nr:MarR family transcriptional regulator [Clavibacter michiganensis]OUE09742.1 hypothetical protein CMsap09_12410 [Clavibacter michiganensis]PPF52720.1 MarR family transcriptional regulator [Clavibacter michiganensis]